MSAGPAIRESRIDTALAGLAVGRLAIGALSRLAPRASAATMLVGPRTTPEFEYMTRVFGIRAIALGSGYLASRGEARRLWQRLAFVCDVSDTLAEVGHLRRKDLPRESSLMLIALTGAYAAVGAAAIVRDAAGG